MWFCLQVTAAIQPHVIFTAHLHISRVISYYPTHFETFTENSVKSFTLFNNQENDKTNSNNKNKYFEIQVPTCSYRMGVKLLGFGLAVIGK